MKKVGLITMHNVFNMGAVLQSYALQRVINENNGECEIIDYIPNLRKGYRNYFPKNQGLNKLRRTASWIKWLPQRIKWKKPYQEFIQEHLILSNATFFEDNEIYHYPFKYDVFVTGSDQVWNPSSTDGVSPYYFLDFVKGHDKVSYAASISNSSLSELETRKITEFLKDFKSISVREMQAIELLSPLVKDISIDFVLDPTFLLNQKQWNDIALESKIHISEKYLLIYMLGDVPFMLDIAKEIANEKNLKIVKFGWDFIKQRNVDYNCSFKKPQDFIKLFINADYVVTNSFHGTAFSINFNKDFISIPSSKGNPRFISILNTLNLYDRLYIENTDIKKYIKSIDYTKTNIILNELKEKSLCFIKDNITNKEL